MTDPRLEAAARAIYVANHLRAEERVEHAADLLASSSADEWPHYYELARAALAAADAVAPTVDRDTLAQGLYETSPWAAGSPPYHWAQLGRDDKRPYLDRADALLAAGVGGGDVGTD